MLKPIRLTRVVGEAAAGDGAELAGGQLFEQAAEGGHGRRHGQQQQKQLKQQSN